MLVLARSISNPNGVSRVHAYADGRVEFTLCGRRRATHYPVPYRLGGGAYRCGKCVNILRHRHQFVGHQLAEVERVPKV